MRLVDKSNEQLACAPLELPFTRMTQANVYTCLLVLILLGKSRLDSYSLDVKVKQSGNCWSSSVGKSLKIPKSALPLPDICA